ncbi:MAG TPA: hypothetical protein H9891_11615 [Candidatus Salinicoccus stercoripullorum]|uniref:Uncharacterized protein n=1 Tax=Candidatus Salinicoccus stercoripullorum TaxID=2838756 RepID=A0A9D1U1F9_9STAP|nr:hypothetical protein [Candidatus Salinicoccus stercoripullorum]
MSEFNHPERWPYDCTERSALAGSRFVKRPETDTPAESCKKQAVTVVKV